MPDPADFDDEASWMAACVPQARDEGRGQDQAVAMCLNMWRDRERNAHARLSHLLEVLECTLKEAEPWEGVPRAPAGRSGGGQWVSGGGRRQRQPSSSGRGGGAASALNIEATTNVSRPFRRTIDGAIAKVPASVQQALDDAGISMKVGETLPDINPDFAGEPPRGWPEGFTWDSVQGAFGENQIMVSEYTLDQRGERNKISKGLTEMTVWHETGHAYDQALEYISETPDFQEAYERDAAAIPEADRPRLNYYLQEGAAGRSETFAQVFGEHVGGRTGRRSTSASFPSVSEFVQEAIGGQE
jgi:hypothetical protein